MIVAGAGVGVGVGVAGGHETDRCATGMLWSEEV